MKSSAERFLVFAGASALAGAAFALTGTALVVRSWSQSPTTVVQASDFSWSTRALSEIEGAIPDPAFSALDVSPIALPNLHADIQAVKGEIRKMRTARRQAAREARLEVARLEHFASEVMVSAAESARVQDQLSTAQAQSLTSPGLASDQELGDMLSAFRTLNSEFQAKLLLPHLPVVEEVHAQPVAQVIVPSQAETFVRTTRVTKVKHRAVKPKSIQPSSFETVAQMIKQVAVFESLVKHAPQYSPTQLETLPASKPTEVTTQAESWQRSLDKAGSQLAQVDQAWNLLVPQKKPIPIRDAAPAVQVTPAQLVSESPVVTTQAAPAELFTGVAYSKALPIKMPARADYPMLPSPVRQVTPPATTQEASKQSDNAGKTKDAHSFPEVASVAARNASRPTASHVEAFEPSQVVNSVVTESITHEGKTSWHLNSKHGYWPTLSRGELKGVPMISDANLKLMGWAAASPILTEAGVVFGRVPAGWEVSFSGRAETPLYLSMRDRRWLSGGVNTEDRYFVFLNAAPGAHLLHIQAKDGSGSGAVVVPVLSGVATSIQVTDPRVRRLAGSVLDAGDAVAAGLSGVRVRVLGNSHPEGVSSGSRGEFQVPSVVTISGHPIWVETDSADGFTHRYQVSSENLESASLFRMRSAQIQGWIGQLEGGVSPESALVVAAVPGELAATGSVGPFRPMIRVLGGESTLKPETYTITSDGRLEVDKVLEPAAPRFLGAQIPEGAVVAEFGAADQAAAWSQLQVTSPRVISVLGGL